MNSYWDGLWDVVKQMGGKEAKSFDITLPPPASVKFNEGLAKGVEIQLVDLDNPLAAGGLLSYNGNQVLVYIPDQGASLDSVLKNPAIGKKFHVSHCKTLEWMQAQNRNHRYVATNNTSGIFDLTDQTGDRRARGALTVCKNCLKHVNYQDYLGRERERATIFKNFSLIEFFSTFSSLFKYPYTRNNLDRQNMSLDAGDSSNELPSILETRFCSTCNMIL